MSYEIYSDESGNGENRFRYVGTLSGKTVDIESLKNSLSQIITSYKLGHCEYKDLDSCSRVDCAKEIFDITLNFVLSGLVKVIVLTWDTHDSRHKINDRDDNKNLGRMYYNIFKQTSKIWEQSSLDYSFYPDENSALDFIEIIKYIENTDISKQQNQAKNIFGEKYLKKFPKIKNHKQISSSKDPIIQIVDILTGISRLNHEEFDLFINWAEDEKQKTNIHLSFFSERTNFQISKRKSFKYEIIKYFNEKFKKNKMQISLNTHKCFFSNKPSCGLWFWTYKSQGDYDKAPIRVFQK